MSRSALGQLIGVHGTTVGRIESGVHAPDLIVAIDLELVSGGELDTLMWRTVAKKRANAAA